MGRQQQRQEILLPFWNKRIHSWMPCAVSDCDSLNANQPHLPLRINFHKFVCPAYITAYNVQMLAFLWEQLLNFYIKRSCSSSTVQFLTMKVLNDQHTNPNIKQKVQPHNFVAITLLLQSRTIARGRQLPFAGPVPGSTRVNRSDLEGIKVVGLQC